jgi:hypothetical protein
MTPPAPQPTTSHGSKQVTLADENSTLTRQTLDTLRSLRIHDVFDTGAELLVAARDVQYRVPARAAGAVRATVMQRQAELDTSDSTATWFFAGQSGGAMTKALLTRRIDRAAAYTSISPAPPSLCDLRIVDLHEAP